MSESGYKRRELFAELMNRLIDNGISAQEARERLLKELRKAPDEDAFLKAIQIPQQ